MAWTVVDDGPAIQVRASITEETELMELIASLQKRLTAMSEAKKPEKENTDG